jgi:hypothetical protein
MTAAPVLPDRLMREVDDTLALLDEVRAAGRRDDVPAWLWLRAARSCWLTDAVDLARDHYKRAAISMTALALETGRRTGNVEQYSHLALGAAWMSQDAPTLSETARQIDSFCEHQLSSTTEQVEALIRVTLILTRMRAAWYRGQKTPLKDLTPELDRRVNQLDAFGKSFWQAERGVVSAAFLKAYGTVKPDPIRAALQEIDRHLQKERANPPTIVDLVDEEFISYAVALRDLQIPLPALHTPITPGGMDTADEAAQATSA